MVGPTSAAGWTAGTTTAKISSVAMGGVAATDMVRAASVSSIDNGGTWGIVFAPVTPEPGVTV